MDNQKCPECGSETKRRLCTNLFYIECEKCDWGEWEVMIRNKKIGSNMIVQTKEGNHYYLYKLNDRLVGFNLLTRNVKDSYHLIDIEEETIIAYWHSGVYHSMIEMINIPKKMFIRKLHKINKTSWVKVYVGE